MAPDFLLTIDFSFCTTWVWLNQVTFVNDLSFRVNDDENQNLLGQALWQIDGDRPLVRWLWILDRSIKRHSR
jgi:hypothetical protein